MTLACSFLPCASSLSCTSYEYAEKNTQNFQKLIGGKVEKQEGENRNPTSARSRTERSAQVAKAPGGQRQGRPRRPRLVGPGCAPPGPGLWTADAAAPGTAGSKAEPAPHTPSPASAGLTRRHRDPNPASHVRERVPLAPQGAASVPNRTAAQRPRRRALPQDGCRS